MKGIDIFCASQSSTSTLDGTTIEGGSLSSIEHSGGSAIDRYNPIIHDQSRLVKTLPLAPSNPQIQDNTGDYISSNIKNEAVKKKKQQKVGKEEKRRSNVAVDDDNYAKSRTSESILNWRRSWSCMNPGAFISPPGSSRYLLSEKTLLNVNVQPDSDSILKLVPAENSKSHAVRKDESVASLQTSSAQVPFQVVVLRVSLHCRGCEKKMRKHISTMEGVSSFNIDFPAKKVTVEGNVTPLGVLESISKVKNAQLWTSSSTTFPVDDDVPAHTISQMKKTQDTTTTPN